MRDKTLVLLKLTQFGGFGEGRNEKPARQTTCESTWRGVLDPLPWGANLGNAIWTPGSQSSKLCDARRQLFEHSRSCVPDLPRDQVRRESDSNPRARSRYVTSVQ